jgi:hypothetical protein
VRVEFSSRLRYRFPVAHSWVLFLDESGALEDFESNAVVAGLLMRCLDSPQNKLRLRSMLERAFPHLVYPMHARLENIPVYHALSVVARGAPPPVAANACRRAVERLADFTPARSLLDAAHARRPQSVAWRDLQAADAWLARTDAGIHRDLVHLRAHWEHEWTRVLAAMTDRLESRPCFVVGAWDVGSEVPHSTQRRYLSLAEACIERALQLIGSHEPPQQRIHLRVSARNIPEGGSGSTLRRLCPADIHEITSRASSFPLHRQGHGVSFLSYRPCSHHKDVHAGLVCADAICNRLYRNLSLRRSWDEIEIRSTRSIALPVRHLPRLAGIGVPLPTLAVDGELRACIRRAFENPAEAQDIRQSLETTNTGWAHEQAIAWVETRLQGGQP